MKKIQKSLFYILPIVILGCILVASFSLLGSGRHVEVKNETQKEKTLTTTSIVTPLSEYIEIIDSCGPYHKGTCVNARSGPGEMFRPLMQLRNGMVLKVSGYTRVGNTMWYKVVFDEWRRYTDRLPKYFYVSGDFVRYFIDEGVQITPKEVPITSTKRIVVDIGDETLTAYEGTDIFMKEKVSTGVAATPTSLGTFFIFRKTPSRYMQGPIPDVSTKIYDLPGVPWDLYFTEGGAVIHGAYWHDKFGQPWSNGCVNLSPENAKKLYYWADVGIPVYVQE